MKSKFLFPAWCAWLGYFMSIPGFILGYLNIINNYEIPGFGFKMREKSTIIQSAFENFTNELAIFLVVIGLILIAFSKTKREDELTARIRINSLYWGVMIYYSCYILGLTFSLTFGEIPFFGDHLLELNIFTPLLIFIFRYYYLTYFSKESYLIGESKFLPNKPYRSIGKIVSIISIVMLVIGIANKNNELLDSIVSFSYLGLTIGLMLWAFSHQKTDDEMVMQQRLESLQLAVYFNYTVLLFATLIFYSVDYLLVLTLAQVSLLLFFIIRMEFVNYKNNKVLSQFEGELSHEK